MRVACLCKFKRIAPHYLLKVNTYSAAEVSRLYKVEDKRGVTEGRLRKRLRCLQWANFLISYV
jgi:hypothetical protein